MNPVTADPVGQRDLGVAGVDAEAARWAEIYKRYDQTLRDRRKLIALVLWEL